MVPPEKPSLSDEEQRIIDNMCSDALFAAWDEDAVMEDVNFHLRQLWQTAFRIGLAQGREEAKAGCRKEDHLPRASVQKKMEQERVWGYDVGWRLCAEVLQDRAQKASVIPPSRSFAVAATQTEAVPNTFNCAVDTDTHCSFNPPPHPVLESRIPLLDADSENHEPTPPSITRDFSGLRTPCARPFASLQRRHRRANRTPGSSFKTLPQRVRPPQTVVLKFYETRPNTRCAQHPNSTSTSRPPPPAPTFDRAPRLDWDRDPRLCDLSRALTALGWIRPG